MLLLSKLNYRGDWYLLIANFYSKLFHISTQNAAVVAAATTSTVTTAAAATTAGAASDLCLASPPIFQVLLYVWELLEQTLQARCQILI